MRKRTINEEQIKQALGTDSFDSLTTEQIENLVSLLPKMNEDSFNSISKQFLDYKETASTALKCLTSHFETICNNNQISQRDSIDICKSLIGYLDAQLEKDNLSSEEREDINSKMLLVAQMVMEKDSENKKVLLIIAGIFAAVVIGVVIVPLALATSSNSRQ